MRLLIIAALTAGLLRSAQDTTAGPALQEPGFLFVECDSTGLDIYVDNMLVGPCPVDTPIPLLPGKHAVTYLHPELLKLLNTHYSKNEIADLTTKSLRTIYVVPGGSVTVKLWWSPYERELKTRKWRFWTKSMVGVALMAVVLGLNLL